MTLTHVHSGKVRDVYGHGDGRLLMVASDRISAFDVVLAEPIPDKGRVLTAMTVFWLEQFADLAPSHLVSAAPECGADTDDILRELGYGAEEIAALRARQVI